MTHPPSQWGYGVSLSFQLFNGLGYFRHYFKCVAYDAIIGGFEERGFRVFVDYNNYFAAVNTGQVLIAPEIPMAI